jgi:hypothetical protein
MLAWATWRYREKFFDRSLHSSNYAGIQSDVITMENQPARLAVSPFFTLEDRRLDGDLAGVTLNVLPLSSDKTVAVFSYADRDRGIALAAFGRILEATGDTQKYELSKLIIGRMENFLIAPNHFRTWSQDKIERIKNAFLETAIAHGQIEEHQDLILF